MVRWTGLAPWEFEFPFPGSLTSTLPVLPSDVAHAQVMRLPWKYPELQTLNPPDSDESIVDAFPHRGRREST